MNLRTLKAGVIAFTLLGLSTSQLAFSDTIKEMIEGGKASLNVRTRYEFVDGQGGATDVNGYSVRTRLGLSTAEVDGFKAMIEFEDLSFNDPDDRPGLDVPTTEINQLWINYQGEGFSAKLGSQIFTLDDHRFIGHVGWRQNIQTYNAATAVFTPTADSKITLGYLARVNRINATTQDLDGLILNGSHKFSDALTLTGFLYNLEFDNWDPMSTSTIGVRAAGAFGEEGAYNYTFSYANQTDAGINSADVDLGYLEASIAGSVGDVSWTVGYESLEGDGTRGFTTPLATVHKFNGFADVFAARSMGLAGGLPQGLEDIYVTAEYKLPVGNGIPLLVSYHLLGAERAGGDLGTEIDFVAKYKLNDYTLLLSKYAYYEAKSGNTAGYGGADGSMFSVEANFTF